ncbi:MAG: hypothetical protein RL748_1359 [Pseudomonadota bacterium]|jgi:DNA polymerase-3 subunit epsilon
MTHFSQPLVVIDFETTGMSPNMGDRITEVAALRIVDGAIAARYVSLVNCGAWISPFITELTGITQAMVDSAPPVADVMPQLVEFIGNDALVAHNASFDEKFLIAESQAQGLQNRHQALLCSVKLTRRVFRGLESYSLGRLARSLGIRFKSAAHRAEADAEVTALVMLHLGQHLHQEFGLLQIDAPLLQGLSKVSAAKAADFLRKQAMA